MHGTLVLAGLSFAVSLLSGCSAQDHSETHRAGASGDDPRALTEDTPGISADAGAASPAQAPLAGPAATGSATGSTTATGTAPGTEVAPPLNPRSYYDSTSSTIAVNQTGSAMPMNGCQAGSAAYPLVNVYQWHNPTTEAVLFLLYKPAMCTTTPDGGWQCGLDTLTPDWVYDGYKFTASDPAKSWQPPHGQTIPVWRYSDGTLSKVVYTTTTAADAALLANGYRVKIQAPFLIYDTFSYLDGPGFTTVTWWSTAPLQTTWEVGVPTGCIPPPKSSGASTLAVATPTYCKSAHPDFGGVVGYAFDASGIASELWTALPP